MDPQQEMQRLKQAFKKREQKRQNVYIANVVDVTPRAESGYVVVRLKDGTQVYAHVWLSEQIAIGQVVFIVPITHEAWNWWVVVGVNATTTPDTVPYVQPLTAQASLPAHTLDNHTGQLPWQRVDTSVTAVDLTSQVSGVLPVLNQQAQTSLATFTVTTPLIAHNAFADGVLTIGTNVAFLKRLVLSGGTHAKVTLYEMGGPVQYEITSVPTPFTDNGGCFLVDYANTRQIRWRVDNFSGQFAVFTIQLFVILFAASVVSTERTPEVTTTAIVKTTVAYDLETVAVIAEAS